MPGTQKGMLKIMPLNFYYFVVVASCVKFYNLPFLICSIRPYGHGRPHEENYDTRGRRDVHGYEERTHFSSRESRFRGRPMRRGRATLMGEERHPRFSDWRSYNQDSFESYPKTEAYHSPRRPSHPKSHHPPHDHPDSYPHSRSQRGPPVHGHHSGHRSPSPRNVHSHPSYRRPGSPPHSRGSFRGHKRPGFLHQEQWNRHPRGNFSSRGRPREFSSHGMKPWNEGEEFSHPYNGEHRPSGSQRSPREMHGRGPVPERYKSEAPAG